MDGGTLSYYINIAIMRMRALSFSHTHTYSRVRDNACVNARNIPRRKNQESECGTQARM
jgi:hypothetical protein